LKTVSEVDPLENASFLNAPFLVWITKPFFYSFSLLRNSIVSELGSIVSVVRLLSSQPILSVVTRWCVAPRRKRYVLSLPSELSVVFVWTTGENASKSRRFQKKTT